MGSSVVGAAEKKSNKKLKFLFKPKRKESKDQDYILPEGVAKRTNISKFYKLSEKILGEGCSGQVCIGEKKGKKFAIKRIRKDRIKFQEHIITEMEISLSVKHKNIMNFYEVYEDLKFINCVMDLGECGDLFDFITNCPLGHLPDDICIDLMMQIFEVLIYLHNEKNIIHRDLKPENFLVYIDNNDKPILKLIDFGLSSYIPPNNKKLRESVGTRAYSAPEMIENCGYDEKIDEWSAGVIMFNMLTGYEPFIGNTPSELKDNIKYCPINFELIKNDDLRELDKKLLNRFADKRVTAQEGLELLKKIKAKENSAKNAMLL